MMTLVVGLAVVGVTHLMGSAVKTQDVHAKRSIDGLMLAREIHELARTLDRAASGAGAATTADGVVALDSLDGAVFTPPIGADLSTLTGLNGWSQSVDVATYDLSDMSTAVSVGVLETIPKGSGMAYKLTVRILENGTEQDVFEWWVEP